MNLYLGEKESELESSWAQAWNGKEILLLARGGGGATQEVPRVRETEDSE